MRKIDLVKQLYSAAEHLKPLVESVSSNLANWDGTQDVKPAPTVAEPVALAWFIRLRTMAGLIEAQESPLSAGQIAYLTSTLFGGMGGLTDLWFNPKTLGDVARDVNELLKKDTGVLFAIVSGELSET